MMNRRFYKKMIYSKSKIAIILRLVAWIILLIALFAGVVESSLLLYVAYAAGVMIFLYAVAAIINYLAEITDILKRNIDEDAKYY